MPVQCQNISPDDPRWRNFIDKFEASNIFHSPEWTKIVSLTSGFEIFPLAAVCNNQLVALAIPVLVRTNKNIRLKYLNRTILYSSPLYLPTNDGITGIQHILNEIKKYSVKKSLFAEIRNNVRYTISENEKKYWEYLPYENYLINLEPGINAIWDNLSKYTRNHIRKGEKKGLEIKEIINFQEYNDAVLLIKTMYQNKNIPFIGDELFYNAWHLLHEKGYIRTIGAYFGQKLIGSRISLNYGKYVYDWYGTANRDYSSYYPNESLAWNSIEWGCLNHFKTFDFGGGAIKGQHYGPAVFKEKFNGTKVEYGRYRHISNQLAYKTGELIYHLISKQ